MRKHLPALVTLGAVVLLAALAVSAPAAHAAARTTSPQVTGTVVNGSHANQPVAGATVTLSEVVAGQTQDLATGTTDAHGRFSLPGQATDIGVGYLITAQFGGGTFASQVIPPDQLGAQPVTLTVVDTTTSDSAISVALTTLLVGEPNTRAGLVSVAESVTVANAGATAYVASATPANGKPMNLLRFSLPQGATNLVLGSGFTIAQATQVSTGLGVATTVLPGTTEFDFAYDLPYTGATLAIPYKAEYATRQVAALIPTDLHVDAGDFAAQPPITAAGKHYQLLVRNDVAAGTPLTFRLRDLPLPGEAPFLNPVALFGVGAVLAALLALLLALYLRRGTLAGVIPAAFRPPVLRPEEVRERARQALLREHVGLDEARAAGKLDDATYRARRADVRARLRALLADAEVDSGNAAAAATMPSRTPRAPDSEVPVPPPDVAEAAGKGGVQ